MRSLNIPNIIYLISVDYVVILFAVLFILSRFCFFYTLQITGIIILSIGATIQGVYHGYKEFLAQNFVTVPDLLIAIGIIIFIIAFFGCCGAIKENYCMITTVRVPGNLFSYLKKQFFIRKKKYFQKLKNYEYVLQVNWEYSDLILRYKCNFVQFLNALLMALYIL